MSTLTLSIAETVEALDFEVPCDGCATPAAWVLRMACCGDVLLACDEHHRQASTRGDSQWTCGACGEWFPVGDSLTEHCVTVERVVA